MPDFSNTKKWQKNKNRQVSFFVKYIFIERGAVVEWLEWFRRRSRVVAVVRAP